MTTPAPQCSTSGKLPLIPLDEGGPDLWVSGEGARFADRGGRTWLDFDLCLGTVVWGHGRREVIEAAALAMQAGSAPSVPSVQEDAAAATLLRRLARYESVRFFKTGGDSCAAAVRLARQATGRDMIVSDGYHGWHDWGVAGAYPETAESLGVPEAARRLDVRVDPADGEASAMGCLTGQGKELAACVLRPEAWPGEVLRRLAIRIRELGALLICDEVTSHLKYSKSGCAAALGVDPDMLCISKGIANGLPLAALLGPARLLDVAGAARISSTNSSETASLAALTACEDLLARAPAWPVWRDSLAAVIEAVAKELHRSGADSKLTIISHPGFFSIERRGIAFATDPFRRHIVASLGRRGLYSRGWFHGSDAHGVRDWEQLEEALCLALRDWAG